MRRKRKISGRKISGRKNQQGVIITLVAVFMLFVIGAMAALSIDVVTLYTARSEAQLAADAAALAGARVLANSGMTSDPTGASMPSAETLARDGRPSGRGSRTKLGEGTWSPPMARWWLVGFATELRIDQPVLSPCTVQRTDMPTFFARIWGTHAGHGGCVGYGGSLQSFGRKCFGWADAPVAPMCVKPWLLPNLDPTAVALPFLIRDGAITRTTTLLGWESTDAAPATRLSVACTWRLHHGATPASAVEILSR